MNSEVGHIVAIFWTAWKAPPPDSVSMSTGAAEVVRRSSDWRDCQPRRAHRACPRRTGTPLVCAGERTPRTSYPILDAVCSIRGDCGTQSEFSKSPPLACWYLPREDEGRPNAGGHSAEGPTPQIPRGGGDVGVSTLALEFAGGRLDRHTKVTLLSAAPSASSAPSSARARRPDWLTLFVAAIQTWFRSFVATHSTPRPS